MRSLTFFQFIKFYFGPTIVSRLKRWIFIKQCLTKLTLRIIFLRKCINYNITPTHLTFCTGYSNMLFNGVSRFRCNKITNRFIKDMLGNEIRDTYVHIIALRREIMDLVRSISMELPISVVNGFFIKQNKSQRLYYDFMEATFDRKFEWLLRKHDRATLTNIRPIRYFCTTPNPSLVCWPFIG